MGKQWAAHRIAVIAWCIGVALLPVHSYVSCDTSGRLGVVGYVAALTTGIAETWFAPYRRWSFAVFGAGGWLLVLLTSVVIH